jgi:glutathione S-transferase
MGNKGNNPFGKKYGFSEAAVARAPSKVVDFLQRLDKMIAEQHALGSSFLLGKCLTALDVYVATCCYIIQLPGSDIMPESKIKGRYRGLFEGSNTPEILNAFTSRVQGHRDFIISTFCECPVRHLNE